MIVKIFLTPFVGKMGPLFDSTSMRMFELLIRRHSFVLKLNLFRFIVNLSAAIFNIKSTTFTSKISYITIDLI